MSAFLFAPLRFQPLNGSGVPYPGALLRFWATGTTTPLDAWTTSAMDVAHDYPIEAGADGKFPAIYLDSTISYRAVLTETWTDPPTNSIYGTLIDDIDPVNSISDIPAGTVVMFMGTAVQRAAAYPSALWTLCDGTNSSYDMRDRAPVGAGSTYNEGDALGSAASLTTSSNGAHTHTGATGSTAADLAAHTHFAVVNSEASSTAVQGSDTYSVTYGNNFTGGDTQYYLRGAATTPTRGLTSSAGAGGGHTHTISSDGAHTHTVTALSPGRALWFLMRKF